MVGKLVHFEMGTSTTETVVKEDNMFVDNGYFSPCGIMENIAQTCAARMGYINQYIYKERVRLGFIGSIKNLQVLRPAREGEVLTTSIEVVQEVLQLTLVNATVKVGDETIVTAEMKIALSDIEVKG